MKDTLSRPNSIPWPPVIVIGCLFAAWILGRIIWIPLELGVWWRLGVLLIIAALMIDVVSMRTMHRANTTILPHRGSDHLVQTGIFSLSRNPIYLANLMIIAGIGFVTGNLWFFVAVPVAAFLIQKLAIEREEAHLRGRFGKVYDDYAKRTRRWL